MTETRASTKVISMRLALEVCARLEREAAGIPLGIYLRAKALGEPPPARLRRSGVAVEDRNALAKALALLGQSRLSSNLNQLAHLGHIGALPYTPEIEAELVEACATIRQIRNLLIEALGLKAGQP